MNSIPLAKKDRVGGTARLRPLTALEVHNLLQQLGDWDLVGTQIQKSFAFGDFKEAMAFVAKVARLAEDMNHHPDIFISYEKVNLTLWTSEIGKLTENDFIAAAKINELPIDEGPAATKAAQ